MNPATQFNSVSATPPQPEEVVAFPLSAAQERIWRHSAGSPADTVFNGAFRISLAGPVDPVILEGTVNEIVSRHEVLRATIDVINGEPLQILAPSLKLELAFEDLSALPAHNREAQFDRLSTEEAQQPFDLKAGPLVRVRLLRLEEQRFVLLLTVHQIVCDGWSIGLIMEELQKIYAARSQGQPSSLPPLTIQFPDFVVWQNECSTRPEAVRQLDYWKKKLRRYRRLELKPDFDQADRALPDGRIVSELLPKQLTDELREFGTRQGGTFFIVTLAACLALLHRYTGEEDLRVGSPLAGRSRADLEDLVGQFVNHIIFRADASADPTFVEFLGRVRDTVWEAFSNQDLPFEKVLQALHPKRDSFRDPLYVVNFICQREYGRAATFNFDFAGVRMSTMPSKTQGALYDLNFFLVEREAGWRLSVEYKTALFREETAQRLLRHFQELLGQIVQDSGKRLSEFTFSDPAPAPNAGTPAGEKLPELYAMPASPVQKRFWLLSQLDRDSPAFHMPAAVRISGPLSHQLLEKAFFQVIQRHETLRTTFDEVDNELAQIISPESSFSLQGFDLTLAPSAGREEKLEESIRREAAAPLRLDTGPLFRACLFRTAPDEHLLLTVIHHILADGWSNKILQDDLWTAYQALSEGREPALPPLTIQFSDFTAWQRDWLDSAEAQQYLDFWLKKLDGELPILNFPTDRPATLRPASHGAIETLLLPPELVRSLKDLGQSENATMFTMLLTAFGILLSRYSGQTDLLVGSPVANRRMETELVIGPFAGPLCLRLDLDRDPSLAELLSRVREVVFDALGHTDLPFESLVEHIKMRTVNGRKPLFQFYFFYQAAFLQPRHIGPLSIEPTPTFSLGIPFELQLAMIERQEGLRAQLEYNPDLFDAATVRNILADYQKILSAMALDRALPLSQVQIAPPQHVSATVVPASPQGEFVPPADDVERRLARIWERVLSVHKVGRTQNYFDLGGNSLLAARLFLEVEDEFGLRLPLSTLFHTQTIADLANLVGRSPSAEKWSSLVEIQPNGSRPPFFCVHGGGGNVLIYRDLSRRLGPDQPFFGFQSQGLDGQQPCLGSIEEMAARYVRELKFQQPSGPYYLGGYCLGGTVALEMARQLAGSGDRVGMVALFDTINWARLRKRNAFDRGRYQLERLIFHAGNFMILDASGKLRFFREKLKVLRGRLTVWRGMLAAQQRPAGKQTESSILANLWETNDRASLNYVPRPFRTPVVDFRPRRQYSVYLEPGVNWDGLALGGLEVIDLPVYPAGMLLEPFVEDLAAALRKALDRYSAATR
jgi:non-ribosomal peptide synthetase component F/thioesterase domain-containing protein